MSKRNRKECEETWILKQHWKKLKQYEDTELSFEEILNLKENNKLLEKGSKQLVEEIKILIKDRETLIEILKDLEFIEDTGRIGGWIFKFCSVCKRTNQQEHKEDCRLNAVLEMYKI